MSEPTIGDPCPICGWPLMASMEDGCVPGNCSMRPRPRPSGMSDQATDWKVRAERAEADAATLRAALLRCYDQWTPPVPDWLIEAALGRTGQQAMGVVCAALAERAELEAARAVVAAVRDWELSVKLIHAMNAYDEAVKARQL
jgi:hypothetical protein